MSKKTFRACIAPVCPDHWASRASRRMPATARRPPPVSRQRFLHVQLLPQEKRVGLPVGDAAHAGRAADGRARARSRAGERRHAGARAREPARAGVRACARERARPRACAGQRFGQDVRARAGTRFGAARLPQARLHRRAGARCAGRGAGGSGGAGRGAGARRRGSARSLVPAPAQGPLSRNSDSTTSFWTADCSRTISAPCAPAVDASAAAARAARRNASFMPRD